MHCNKVPKLFIIGLSLLALLSALYSTTEARYLPTRADERDVEVLRELIRAIMAESNQDARVQQLNRMNGFYHQPMSGDQFQVQRRSAEMPMASTNGQQGLLKAMVASDGASN